MALRGCAFVQIVLARILAPEEFGLLASLLVFVSLSDILILGGARRLAFADAECPKG